MNPNSAQNRNRNAKITMSRRGFSLLELTLVLVILGVLGAVAAVNVLGQGNEAKISATEASMQVVNSQIKSWMLKNNNPPATLQEMVNANLLEAKSIKDAWGRNFLYRAPGISNPYELMSTGNDPEDPSDDLNIWTLEQ